MIGAFTLDPGVRPTHLMAISLLPTYYYYLLLLLLLRYVLLLLLLLLPLPTTLLPTTPLNWLDYRTYSQLLTSLLAGGCVGHRRTFARDNQDACVTDWPWGRRHLRQPYAPLVPRVSERSGRVMYCSCNVRSNV
ncbi:hypothetical protein GGS21DRAFT_271357 [Xylaria nigripes]|nr:hypothetical protein GGS21DRAFT_271357 [Xylaria nigripes]